MKGETKQAGKKKINNIGNRKVKNEEELNEEGKNRGRKEN